MIIFISLFLLILLLLIASLVRSFRQRNNPDLLSPAEIGAVSDRALRAYRQRFVPLLTLAAILAPLGVGSPLLAPLALQLIWPISDIFFFYAPPTPWLLLARIGVVLTALGLGRSLLMLGAAYALTEEAEAQSLKTISAALRHDWKRALILAIPLSAPSLLMTLVVASATVGLMQWGLSFGDTSSLIVLMIVGLPLLLITALATNTRWALAPAVMRYESLGPLAAIRRSAQIVDAQRSGVSNLSLELWLIGWLVVSVPGAGGLLLLQLATPLAPELIGRLAVLLWMLGSVFVAPLLALGQVEFYLSARDRTAGLSERIERFVESHI
jgi:hypothetical protein